MMALRTGSLDVMLNDVKGFPYPYWTVTGFEIIRSELDLGIISLPSLKTNWFSNGMVKV